MFMALFVSCGDDNITTNIQVGPTRNADPNEWWRKWNDPNSPAYVLTAELRDGKASHSLPVAELIYYCCRENKINNPVTLLVFLEGRNLLSKNEYNRQDFEKDLALSTNYDPKWCGFYPQLVALTYQWSLDSSNGKTFNQSYASFPAYDMSWEQFKVLYDQYRQKMNLIAGTNYLMPADDGSGFYDDFQEITIEQIQQFLEGFPNTALKRKTLFQEQQLPSVINYDAFDPNSLK